MNFIKVKDIHFADAYIQIFDLLDDGIMVVDMEGKLVVYNEASEKLDKLSKEDVIGKHIQDCFQTESHTSITLEVLKTRKSLVNVYQSYITIEGKKISSVSSAYPLMKDNKMLGVFTLTKDITKFNETLDVFYKHDIESADQDDGRAKFQFDDIIGQSSELKKCIDIAKATSKTNSNILIYGATGTGKELFAQSIHNNSLVPGPFVSINCAAIPENLLEGLLFGTTEGAFTGAKNHPGLFEEAKNGTLFLDELNSMPPNLQPKLLRAIETGKIRRVGETRERIVKPRIISALNIHPLDAIENHDIRMDLFYRLGVITIVIPPLKDRLDDIPILVDKFINKFNIKLNKNIKGVTPEVEEIFNSHNWPGNVRELEHSIEHSMIITTEDKCIQKENLPIFLTEDNKFNNNNTLPMKNIKNLDETLENTDLTSLINNIEKQIIKDKINEAQGNITAAARKLGISRQNLEYRTKKYHL